MQNEMKTCKQKETMQNEKKACGQKETMQNEIKACGQKKTMQNDMKAYAEKMLSAFEICQPDAKIREKVQRNWDAVAKPLDGMGMFEKITAQIGSIQGTERAAVEKRAVIVFCADNGIVAEGISQSGQEVTAAVAHSMGKQASSVGIMGKQTGTDVIPVDIGICGTEQIPGVLSRKVMPGTGNFAKEPAMMPVQTMQGIQTGIELAGLCKKRGYQLLATGEMGIGNTTTSSAVAAALLGCTAAEVTGRGAGLSDAGLLHKQQVITDALRRYQFGTDETFRILSCVGGLDIAGMAGLCIGGAYYQIPVVLDGVISVVAALVAERLKPGTKEYLIASHKSREPATEKMLKELGLKPVIDADLALGEGSGAVLLFPLLDAAMAVYRTQTTFSDIRVEQYTRFTEDAHA